MKFFLSYVVNFVRRLTVERDDDRLLVQRWKDAFKPEPAPIRHRNLILVRSQSDVWARKGNAA